MWIWIRCVLFHSRNSIVAFSPIQSPSFRTFAKLNPRQCISYRHQCRSNETPHYNIVRVSNTSQTLIIFYVQNKNLVHYNLCFPLWSVLCRVKKKMQNVQPFLSFYIYTRGWVWISLGRDVCTSRNTTSPLRYAAPPHQSASVVGLLPYTLHTSTTAIRVGLLTP
jgi:hypothetical protein